MLHCLFESQDLFITFLPYCIFIKRSWQEQQTNQGILYVHVYIMRLVGVRRNHVPRDAPFVADGEMSCLLREGWCVRSCGAWCSVLSEPVGQADSWMWLNYSGKARYRVLLGPTSRELPPPAILSSLFLIFPLSQSLSCSLSLTLSLSLSFTVCAEGGDPSP